MKRFLGTIFVVVGLNAGLFAQQSCSDLSAPTAGAVYTNYNTNEHFSGFHTWREYPQGSCTYSGGTQNAGGPTPCSVDSEAWSTFDQSNSYDTGALSTVIPFRKHVGTFNQVSGGATANLGGSATSGTEAAYGVQGCTVNCSTTITFSGGGSAGAVNGNVNVSFSPTPLWPDKHNYTNTCVGITLPALRAPVGQPPYCGGATTNCSYYWNYSSCSWTPGTPPGGGGTPIVIDTAKTGFAFSDPKKGQYVTFDLQGNGKPLKLSWPVEGSGNAWLAYDRDGDGVIKDGTELFGNYSPHSNFTNPNMPASAWNGFIALDWYDLPEQGGTGDTILDKNDKIWSKLRLWIDTHCYKQPNTPCQSLPSELHPLESFGITSISLEYQYDPQNYDSIGNRFEFWAYLNPELGTNVADERGHHLENPQNEGAAKRTQDGRKAYDVVLTTAP